MLLLVGWAFAACDPAGPPRPPAQAPDLAADRFLNFETIPTRSLELSPDGARLFAVNTPDGRLEVFDITPQGLELSGSVTVGLDPVALAARSDTEVWVVNFLSDSVSVVDVSPGSAPHVTRTLLVGDEPRDIVFAGPNRGRAFVTAARRGQNHPADIQAELQTPGIGRADVWVFDADDLGTSLHTEPLTILQLFADKPGALAASADGSEVSVSIFTSGNQTTIIDRTAVCRVPDPNAANTGGAGGVDLRGGGGGRPMQNAAPCPTATGGVLPGGLPAPNVNQVDGADSPNTSLIVRFDTASGSWLDGLGRDWRDAVAFELPDKDVFVIDAMASPPREKTAFSNVGTLNKSIAVDPVSGDLFVATIEAFNMNRFLSLPRLGLFPNPTPESGVAPTADPATGRTLNGHLYESRIAILSEGGGVTQRHLNKHIDYEVVPSEPGVKERSVADPQGLAFSPDGRTLFVAGLGSNKIVPFDTAELRDDSFVPDASTHIQLSGDGGPTSMVLTADGARMFVYRRFDNEISTIDLAVRREVSVTALSTPEPAEVTDGRKFFYDALLTSSNGEANCNVCHPAGDKDDLAWNLGSPFMGVGSNTNAQAPGGQRSMAVVNPLKGPMTVLTLRGLHDGGPMFWRGDATNDVDPLNERSNFQNFNVVFEALLGRETPLDQADFDRFTDWALSITPPPNPNRPLDNQLNPSQAAGEALFFGGMIDGGVLNCNSCHVTNPGSGFFGTRGDFFPENQDFKITGLRPVYDKIGAFGRNDGKPGDPRVRGGARTDTGPQIRGYGTLHDGSMASIEEFITTPGFIVDEARISQIADFVLAFPTNLAPVVGQQTTLRADSDADVLARIDLLERRAGAPFVMPGNQVVTECELVAKAVIDGSERGFLFQPSTQQFLDDGGGQVSRAALRALAQTSGQEVTFTCMYPGGGRRLALDRNQDGVLDAADSGAVNAPAPPAMQPPPTPGGGAMPVDPPMQAPAPAPGMQPNLLEALVRFLFGVLFGGAGG